jgi:hypothetical protein
LGLAPSDFKQAAVLKRRHGSLYRVTVPDLAGKFRDGARHGIARQEHGEDCALDREVRA